jgi:hypothetical protein
LAGLYKLNPVNPDRLKAPGFNTCTFHVISWSHNSLSSFACQFNLYRYALDSSRFARKRRCSGCSRWETGTGWMDTESTSLEPRTGRRLAGSPAAATSATRATRWGTWRANAPRRAATAAAAEVELGEDSEHPDLDRRRREEEAGHRHWPTGALAAACSSGVSTR